MFVKIVRYETKDRPGRDDTFPCSHIGKEVVREGTVAARDGSPVGILLELSPVDQGGKIVALRLPDDGDVAFIMNDAGSTIDRVVWPPRGG
jgi:hypothetical protein